jgi:CBS domain-containing protein
MNVASLCRPDVVTIHRSEEVMAAAALMRERHVGYLVVAETDLADGGVRPVGVLTDRDIVVSIVARGADPRSLRVEDVMTREPVCARDSDSISDALETMRRIGVRRVPVVDSLGRLAGVLSLDDILDALSDQLANVAGSIRSEQLVENVMRR